MKKFSSMFDRIHPTLNPTFWNGTVLRTEVPATLIRILEKFYPLNKIERLIMIGSNVTYQYNDESDVDINLIATPGESYDKWHQIFKANSDKYLYPGTKHAVNFFFNEYSDSRKLTFENALGAYDIQAGIWMKKSTPPNAMRDPSLQFDYLIEYGDAYANTLEYTVRSLAKLFQEQRKVAPHSEQWDHIQDEIKTKIAELSYHWHKMDDNRKLAYQYHIGGTPALQENNILFKYIEHGPLGPLFNLVSGLKKRSTP